MILLPQGSNETQSELQEINIANEKDKLDFALQEWKVIIETQMHFNEMLMKMRTTGISVVIAIFGAAAYSLQFSSLMLTICGVTFHAAASIILVGVVMLISIFIIDFGYYYKMLLGSVEEGKQFGEIYKGFCIDGRIPFGLTSKICEKVSQKRASGLLVIFYMLVILFGVLFLCAVFFGYIPPTN